MHTPADAETALAMFMDNQRLPASFRDTATQWYLPLAERISQLATTTSAPFIVGINAGQGCGKTTLAGLLCALLNARGIATVTLALDDFYHTAAERHHLGDAVHPLLETRGVPGTHDIPMLTRIIDALGQSAGDVHIPCFNKAMDDRYPETEWKQASLPVQVIILEGWCLGTPPQADTELQTPVNSFEADEDHDHQWRRFVNEQLRTFYPTLFNRVNYWVMLKAPNFDCVYRWRQEQEERLTDTQPGNKIMSGPQLRRFIQHYERLTRHTLKALPEQVNELFCLDENRNITGHQQR